MGLTDLLRSDRIDPCVGAAESVQESIKLMTEARSGCVFVLDGQKQLIGILTDGDVRRVLERSGEIASLRALDVMTRDPIRITEDASLTEAFHLFQKHVVNVLPVLDSQGNYRGYVNFHDVTQSLSPERIYVSPETGDDENVQRHVARYAFAASFLTHASVVLDCACGSGYGSELLAAKAARVIGIDQSAAAIDYARARHASPKTVYTCQPLETLEFQSGDLDAVVSLETLEHVPPRVCIQFLRNAAHWLQKGGVLVASSPMLRYRDGRPFVTNPYHVNEMPKDELVRMFACALPGYLLHYYHQRQDAFLPLLEENTGFCVVVARKPE